MYVVCQEAGLYMYMQHKRYNRFRSNYRYNGTVAIILPGHIIFELNLKRDDALECFCNT